jgi:hypothetical protein
MAPQSSGLKPRAGGLMFIQHISLLLVTNTSTNHTQVVTNVEKAPKLKFLDILEENHSNGHAATSVKERGTKE